MAMTKSVRRQSGLHHPVSVYAKQVVRGKLHDKCCPYEIAACQRHLDDLKRQGTKAFPYVLILPEPIVLFAGSASGSRFEVLSSERPSSCSPGKCLILAAHMDGFIKTPALGDSREHTTNEPVVISKARKSPARLCTICVAMPCIRHTTQSLRFMSKSRRLSALPLTVARP